MFKYLAKKSEGNRPVKTLSSTLEFRVNLAGKVIGVSIGLFWLKTGEPM